MENNIIRDCHYCQYAACEDADLEVDCYVEDGGYFDHHVKDSNEAKNCSDFWFCDYFPKY